MFFIKMVEGIGEFDVGVGVMKSEIVVVIFGLGDLLVFGN